MSGGRKNNEGNRMPHGQSKGRAASDVKNLWVIMVSAVSG